MWREEENQLFCLGIVAQWPLNLQSLHLTLEVGCFHSRPAYSDSWREPFSKYIPSIMHLCNQALAGSKQTTGMGTCSTHLLVGQVILVNIQGLIIGC